MTNDVGRRAGAEPALVSDGAGQAVSTLTGFDQAQGSALQAICFALRAHDYPAQSYEFLRDWSVGSLERWPDYLSWIRREPSQTDGLVGMLTRDCTKMRQAGTALAEAALYTVREYDGVHRLALAVAEWSRAVASEGDRDRRYSPDGRDKGTLGSGRSLSSAGSASAEIAQPSSPHPHPEHSA